jgi:hypothetical protein
VEIDVLMRLDVGGDLVETRMKRDSRLVSERCSFPAMSGKHTKRNTLMTCTCIFHVNGVHGKGNKVLLLRRRTRKRSLTTCWKIRRCPSHAATTHLSIHMLRRLADLLLTGVCVDWPSSSREVGFFCYTRRGDDTGASHRVAVAPHKRKEGK